MKRVMLVFSILSGLHASQEKIDVYFRNVKDEIVEIILQATGFQR